MKVDDWIALQKEMVRVYEADKSITHIQITFHIQPIINENKTAIINVKTFNDEITKENNRKRN